MNTYVRLTITRPDEFVKIRSGVKKLLIRAEHRGQNNDRRHPRLRPQVDSPVRLILHDVVNEMCAGYCVQDVFTVAIFPDDDHPLWINGEPVSHMEQYTFAKYAGCDSWDDFVATDLALYPGEEFHGYAVEFGV